jgi:predicted short-subunit dehydrogenase-like oxidoreductase (DUF2520 family)
LTGTEDKKLTSPSDFPEGFLIIFLKFNKGADTLKIGFIGAGKVGCGFGFLLSKNNVYVSGYLSKNIESAKYAAVLTKSAYYDNYDAILKDSDVIIISTNDTSIDDVVQELIKYKHLIKDKVFAHLSGAITLKILNSISEIGGHGMVIHPVQTCPSINAAISLLPESYITIEGDSIAINIGKYLAEKIGAKPIIISDINKPLYHAACVVVSNYLVTLTQAGLTILKSSGFPVEKYPDVLIPLMEGTLKNINEKGCLNSLSGPVARGDTDTIKLHLENISEEEILKLYKTLGKMTLNIASKIENFPYNKYNEMEDIFNG